MPPTLFVVPTSGAQRSTSGQNIWVNYSHHQDSLDPNLNPAGLGLGIQTKQERGSGNETNTKAINGDVGPLTVTFTVPPHQHIGFHWPIPRGVWE